ncbi:MAG: glycosyl hydrolase 53 family protein [Muribaculaceae bacterium]|nr:glycosyl hydrolase 53 family protein [Muribaculaceae bacterium]
MTDWLKHITIVLALTLTAFSANADSKGDVNGDGEVNIADVNTLIHMILTTEDELCGDVNEDCEITIADVNMLISIILGGLNPQPYDGPVVGGDISMLTKYETHQRMATQHGINYAYYRDVNNQRIDDVIAWTKQQGWNAARVRLFVNPENASAEHVGQGVIQNLDTVKVLGARIKAAGMQFMLDFHYSDTWADPSAQTTPAAWASLDDEALAIQVYEYTRDCMRALKAAGATPDYIQTGNEISYGMLWGPAGTPQSQLKQCFTTSPEDNWVRFANLLIAAGKACREECPRAKIILHTERVPRINVLTNFYTQMKNRGVDYDIIGLSYYPYYHGNLAALAAALNSVSNMFQDKDIMIVETGYSYHYKVGDQDFSSTWPLTAEGQRQFTIDLINKLKPYNRVKGLFWWFPEANEYGLGGSNWNILHVTDSWYNAGLWNHETGRALPALYELKSFLE